MLIEYIFIKERKRRAEVIELYFYENKPMVIIGHIMGMPKSSVRHIIKRFRVSGNLESFPKKKREVKNKGMKK